MDALPELRAGVQWAQGELSFDVDVRVHVFELTIRVLGGLLAAHSALIRDKTLVPGETTTLPGGNDSILINLLRCHLSNSTSC